jgi:hypothetical protein
MNMFSADVESDQHWTVNKLHVDTEEEIRLNHVGYFALVSQAKLRITQQDALMQSHQTTLIIAKTRK